MATGYPRGSSFWGGLNRIDQRETASKAEQINILLTNPKVRSFLETNTKRYSIADTHLNNRLLQEFLLKRMLFNHITGENNVFSPVVSHSELHNILFPADKQNFHSILKQLREEYHLTDKAINEVTKERDEQFQAFIDRQAADRLLDYFFIEFIQQNSKATCYLPSLLDKILKNINLICDTPKKQVLLNMSYQRKKNSKKSFRVFPDYTLYPTNLPPDLKKTNKQTYYVKNPLSRQMRQEMILTYLRSIAQGKISSPSEILETSKWKKEIARFIEILQREGLYTDVAQPVVDRVNAAIKRTIS